MEADGRQPSAVENAMKLPCNIPSIQRPTKLRCKNKALIVPETTRSEPLFHLANSMEAERLSRQFREIDCSQLRLVFGSTSLSVPPMR